VRDLVPANLTALKDAKQLQNTTKVSGEIDVIPPVGAKDFTDPAVINWMVAFQKAALCAHATRRDNFPRKRQPGVKGAARSSTRRCRCPTSSAPRTTNDPKAGQGIAGRGAALLLARPVISSDRKTANSRRSGSG
jgi:hypothetical protein